MITSYQRGYKREIDLIKRLRVDGKFHTIIRSAGSRTPFDIVAISKSKILLIQVKTGKGRFKKELRRLKRIRVPFCTKKQLWVYDRGWKMLFSS